MLKRRTIAVVAAALSVTALAAVPARAAYPEKDITIVIPFGPGGGFDVYVRMIGPYLEKHLPTKVNVVPKNVPGAASERGTTEVYRAKPDGYTLGIINVPGAMINPIMGKKVAYDLDKMTWIARLSFDSYILVVPAKSDIKTMADYVAFATKGPVKMPSVGEGTTADAAARIFLAVYGFKGEMIPGYKGTKDMTLGVIRGDTPSGILPSESTRSFITSGDLRALMTTADPSDYPNVPSAKSLGKPELDGLFVHRLIAAPPGLPSDIKNALEKAFLDAMADPELKAVAEKANRPLAPLNATEAEAAVKQQLQLYLRFKAALAGK
jgi:tripartite-type tricarboxylate transporter receptor subunit TctC